MKLAQKINFFFVFLIMGKNELINDIIFQITDTY